MKRYTTTVILANMLEIKSVQLMNDARIKGLDQMTSGGWTLFATFDISYPVGASQYRETILHPGQDDES